MMNVQDYLFKFRKCTKLTTLESLYERLNNSTYLSEKQRADMWRAADHRRAELIANRLFDISKVPPEIWAHVK